MIGVLPIQCRDPSIWHVSVYRRRLEMSAYRKGPHVHISDVNTNLPKPNLFTCIPQYYLFNSMHLPTLLLTSWHNPSHINVYSFIRCAYWIFSHVGILPLVLDFDSSSRWYRHNQLAFLWTAHIQIYWAVPNGQPQIRSLRSPLCKAVYTCNRSGVM